MIALEERKRCGECGLSPPPKPTCHWCRQEMEDWPDDPAQFLFSRGWTRSPVEGRWIEPEDKWTEEVSDGMLEDARSRVRGAQEYLELPSVQKSGDRRLQGEDTLRVAEEHLARLEGLRERGERTDLHYREVKCFRGTDRMGAVVNEMVPSVERLSPWHWLQRDAVLYELNLARPKQPPKKIEVPRFGQKEMEEMERTLTFVDRGNLSPQSRATLNRKRSERLTVTVEQCDACHRWPSSTQG